MSRIQYIFIIIAICLVKYARPAPFSGAGLHCIDYKWPTAQSSQEDSNEEDEDSNDTSEFDPNDDVQLVMEQQRLPTNWVINNFFCKQLLFKN